MAPPHSNDVEQIVQEIEKLNLQKLAREKGSYLVYPDTTVCLFSIRLQKWLFFINSYEI